MIVIDTSVFVDFLVKFDNRKHYVAKSFMDTISEKDINLYGPFLFDIELVEFSGENLMNPKL
jgi:predicted nucleic acid-binding protein